MPEVKFERSLKLAERILNLNKKNSNILISIIDEMEINESIINSSMKVKEKN